MLKVTDLGNKEPQNNPMKSCIKIGLQGGMEKGRKSIGICHVASAELKQGNFKFIQIYSSGFMKIGKLEVTEGSVISQNITTSIINIFFGKNVLLKEKNTLCDGDGLLVSFCKHDGCKNTVSCEGKHSAQQAAALSVCLLPYSPYSCRHYCYKVHVRSALAIDQKLVSHKA